MITNDKAAARIQAKAQRRAIPAGTRADAGARAAALFMGAIPLPPASTVSAYWPLGDEFDSRPLLDALLQSGHKAALPVVVGADQPLIFRQWQPGDDMAVSSFGVSEPREAAGEVRPNVVVAPFLAFNAQGFRLGYGGGYYDRTLRTVRQSVPGLLAVGLGFELQEMATLPHDSNDEPLDWLISEHHVRQFHRN
mgnify:FL=1